jgi:acetyl esterase/lipase
VSEDRSVLSRTAPGPDEVLVYGNHGDQVVDLWYGESGRALVVLLHGGFWRPEFDRTHLRPMATALRDEGWPVAAVEYRRLPGRPDVTTGDVRRALAMVERPMVLAGHSAGGHLALWAAAQQPGGITGVLALAPVADLVMAERLDLDGGAVAAFLGGPAADRPDLDPNLLPDPQTPVTVVHGTADGRVPYAMTETYSARHPEARIVRLDGADHFAVIDPASAAWPTVLAELGLRSRA